MTIELALWILIPSVLLTAAALWFSIAYGRRDPKKQPENVELLKNVDEAEKKGSLTSEDAKVIRDSING
jgi:hypothetical protein